MKLRSSCQRILTTALPQKKFKAQKLAVVILLEINIEKDYEEVEKRIAKNALQKRDTLIGSFKNDKTVTHRGGSDDEVKTGTKLKSLTL